MGRRGEDVLLRLPRGLMRRGSAADSLLVCPTLVVHSISGVHGKTSPTTRRRARFVTSRCTRFMACRCPSRSARSRGSYCKRRCHSSAPWSSLAALARWAQRRRHIWNCPPPVWCPCCRTGRCVLARALRSSSTSARSTDGRTCIRPTPPSAPSSPPPCTGASSCPWCKGVAALSRERV